MLSSLVMFAGDVSPIDIMCHMPGVCEDKDIPYAYTPSREVSIYVPYFVFYFYKTIY